MSKSIAVALPEPRALGVALSRTVLPWRRIAKVGSLVRLGLLSVAFGWLAIATMPTASASKVAFDEALRRSDEMRSTDPKAFVASLDRIASSAGKLTPLQREYLRLLRGYSHSYRGRYDLAIKEASELFKQATDPTIRFRAGALLVNNAAVIRDYALGLRYLSQTLELDDGQIDPAFRDDGRAIAAILYNQLGQYALGQHYAEQVLGREPTPRLRCVARHLRIEAIYGLGSWITEGSEVNDAIASCVAQKDVIAASLIRGYLARHLASSGKVNEAIELLEQHLPEVMATGYPRLIGEVHGLLAEYRLIRGDVSIAERHAREALAKGGKDNFSLPLVAAYKVLYEAALRRDDLPAALEQFRRYAEADKARLDEIKAREFAFQLSRNELQQKNQAIELLQKQNEVLKLQQEVSEATARNTQLLLALLVMVLAAIGYWAYKVKRVQVMFRRQAEIDGLTGLSNRGHFRENAEALLQRCAGAGREASLVLLDLDHFKHINDRHGHAVGDWVLQQVAVAIQSACREGDVCGRLGGEEFAILSCGSDIDGARRIAQRCSEHLAAIDTSVIGRPVTASFGCTTTVRSGYAFESMFAHADAAMYQAKSGGRDRVRAYGEDGVPAPVLELVRG